MTALVFDVVGRVAPQGSKSKGKGGRLYEASKYLATWRGAVTLRARQAVAATPDFDRGAPAVKVLVTFRIRRPRSHYFTGARAHLLRPDAPTYAPVVPDVDKACRAVLDALKDAGAIVDDRRVAILYASKVYATRELPGAQIIVEGMDHA